MMRQPGRYHKLDQILASTIFDIDVAIYRTISEKIVICLLHISDYFMNILLSQILLRLIQYFEFPRSDKIDNI